ncbi:hypothetical protein BpHYR1_031210 [Brachionus plicatilis]|uniref:Uncharacterized protein n=1 Tax=Brachionus plicatilis TaxID=10195 RepID=A0A3M7Q916_BRAPC|nr:hypothetical protein BpHYR1_031210 [Brachionus plicatilis]
MRFIYQNLLIDIIHLFDISLEQESEAKRWAYLLFNLDSFNYIFETIIRSFESFFTRIKNAHLLNYDWRLNSNMSIYLKLFKSYRRFTLKGLTIAIEKKLISDTIIKFIRVE